MWGTDRVPDSRKVPSVGSLRNPVGPLPSSIYWRRRAVLASVVALLSVLALWVVTSGGGKTSTNGKGEGRPDPVSSITPGPAGTGPAISQAPGGRTESGGDGTGSEGGGSAGTGKNGEPGSGSASGSGSGQGSASGGAGGGPDQVPADSPLPTCAPSAVQWEVKSAKNEYEANEKPRLELTARNTSGTTCKVDLGPKQAVLTILQASSTKAVWSSADCPAGAGNVFFRIPAQGESKQSLDWDRKFSAAGQCDAPPAGAAVPDTYVVEVKAPGMPVARTSFVLKQD
ncbi:hypothetical protein Sxan_63650 [Streptomyces xanthophaeus]|uniref:DUF4232 domain-containing protein n=1 Tax=Streptomyces xanthophaeus TaxID=67385 RepID=A0A919LFI7_9ACTN|nr:hypothetical protein Sxan_63650 [Streptomyces xanthophaeus]